MTGISIGMFRELLGGIAKIVSCFLQIISSTILTPKRFGSVLRYNSPSPPLPHRLYHVVLCWFSVAAATVAVVRTAVAVVVPLLIANLLGKTGSIWGSTASCSAMCVAPKLPVENTFHFNDTPAPAPVPVPALVNYSTTDRTLQEGGRGTREAGSSFSNWVNEPRWLLQFLDASLLGSNN